MKTEKQHICHCEEPARRDGAGQLQRFLKALDPTFAPVDGRSLEDLLVFTKRYANQIRFHQFPNQQDDNLDKSWHDFFRHDLSVLASSIATVDLAQIKKDYDEINQRLNNLCDQPTPDNHAMLEAFKALFDPIMGIAKRIDRWYSATLSNQLIRQDLDLLLDSFLAFHLAKGVHYAQTFAEVNKGKVLNLHLEVLENQHVWQIEGLHLDKITKPFEDDESIYDFPNLAEQLRNASLFVEDIFQAFFQGISKIVNRGDDYLQNSLEQYPAHQPQMALFIAFLELFRLAQQQMNGLTEKHLQFYYRDVLRLQEKPAQPDKAFIVFELAQNVLEHHLAKHTALDAGKDKIGKDLQYELTKDFVVHQAKVASLKTFYLLNYQGKIVPLPRPIANSADGFGGKFMGKNKAWQTFGTFDFAGIFKKVKDVQNICELVDLKNFAEENGNFELNKRSIGFAIASPQLVLGGGKRLVKISFQNAKKIFADKNSITIQLTGEKGWIELHENPKIDDLVNVFGKEFPNENALEKGYWFDGKTDLYVYLPIKEKAIIPFDAKVHTDANFDTKYPVMQVLMQTISADLKDWNALEMDKMVIEVQVGSIIPMQTSGGEFPTENEGELRHDGVTNLLAQNDNSEIADVNKAFDTFGFYPNMGSSFYVGSEEIFNKPIQGISIQADTNNDWFGAALDVKILEDRFWKKVNNDFIQKKNLSSNIFEKGDIKEIERNEIISINSFTKGLEKGFLKITIIKADLSTDQVLENMQRLKTNRLSVSYHSILENLNPNIDQFFHIYPFGTAEISAIKSNKTGVINTDKLLPNFTYENLSSDSLGEVFSSKKDKISWSQNKAALALLNAYQKLSGEQDLRNQYTGNIQEQGHLFIGLEDLKPLESLSLLFQFAEGSANDEDHDPPKIHWSYLTNNQWRPLRNERITSDSTFGFRATGIMTFDIPADITDKNTLIYTEKPTAWLCASVTEKSDTFPQLIDIVAQATEVQLVDNQNDSSHFDEALKAESITKLVIRTADIQSVKQPFASFEGKAPEVGRPFYTRVSERLRHKARAINAWDYEHLVLNQYPNVFKVKCVQHTDPNCLCREVVKTDRDGQGLETKTNECCGSQIAPGHVMIVPIPNLKNRVEVNPLKPKNSRRTLVSIEEYLKKRTSPFVHIHARNPVYEPILTMFKVQFYEGFDKGFYLKFLNDEIVKYLSPWAFNLDVDVSFDNKIYASSIINFIEERPYVDFITDFLMIHCKHNCCPEEMIERFKGDGIPDLKDCEEWEDFLTEKLNENGEFMAVPFTPRSILTSVNQHLISIFEAPVVLSPCEKK